MNHEGVGLPTHPFIPTSRVEFVSGENNKLKGCFGSFAGPLRSDPLR